MHRTILLSLLFTTLACGEESSADGDAKADEAEASQGWDIQLPPELDSFDMDAVLAAWQGDHIVRNQGNQEAWHVDGDKLTSFRAGEEKEYKLDLFSPCKAGATRIDEKGVFSNNLGFSVLEGKLLQNPSVGDPPVIQQGNQMVACDSFDFVYFDGTSCTFFEKKKADFDNNSYGYEGQSAECEVKTNEWGNSLSYKTESMHKPSGARIYASLAEIPEDLRDKVVVKKYASFDEAKAALK
jgi:hypothetical protein